MTKVKMRDLLTAEEMTSAIAEEVAFRILVESDMTTVGEVPLIILMTRQVEEGALKPVGEVGWTVVLEAVISIEGEADLIIMGEARSTVGEPTSAPMDEEALVTLREAVLKTKRVAALKTWVEAGLTAVALTTSLGEVALTQVGGVA